jgi:hypothetical protein
MVEEAEERNAFYFFESCRKPVCFQTRKAFESINRERLRWKRRLVNVLTQIIVRL